MAIERYSGQGIDASPSQGPPEFAYTQRIDYVGGSSPIYLGWALSSNNPGGVANQPNQTTVVASTGPETSKAIWAIQKLTYDGTNLVLTQWADGNTAQDNKWDDRATLTYQ